MHYILAATLFFTGVLLFLIRSSTHSFFVVHFLMALALPPGLSIPTELSGVDISRHDSIVPEIVKINVTFIALVALVVTARMGVRISVVRALGMDDGEHHRRDIRVMLTNAVLMLLAGISLIVFSSVALYGKLRGFTGGISLSNEQ